MGVCVLKRERENWCDGSSPRSSSVLVSLRVPVRVFWTFSHIGPLVYSGVHYRACIPQAWPPSCPLGLHLGLIGSCCYRKPWFTRAEHQASDMQLCADRKGKLCITPCVFYGGESRPGELNGTECDSMIDRCQGGVWHELRCDISQFPAKDRSRDFFY